MQQAQHEKAEWQLSAIRSNHLVSMNQSCHSLVQVPAGYVVLPIYPGLTAIVQANSTLIPSNLPEPVPASSPSLNSSLPEDLLNALPDFGTPAGSVLMGIPPAVNATAFAAATNSTLYEGQTIALPANETYFAQPVQSGLVAMFPGFPASSIFGSILGLAA